MRCMHPPPPAHAIACRGPRAPPRCAPPPPRPPPFPQFEEIFTKIDAEGKGGLSLGDIVDLVLRDANIFDPAGW